ncbi:MAG: epoxyqueuosine reductase [Phycisphaerae bacterium]|nr:MAG: epoxyqueuosine reductase [Phycisphaerae bacterium]
MHGSMAYLADEIETRTNPGRIFDGTRAFIVVADQYARRGEPEKHAPGEGRIARYARGRDYHAVMKRRLHALADALRERYAGADFRSCVDTAPVPERELAALAGLGWVGKNTMVIHPRIGSWFVLGVMATNLELEATSAGGRVADHCGTCTRCIEACPTGAITPYRVDASRCVSYLTIEHRGEIPAAMHAGIGTWVYGCDVCQEVCPHNSARAEVGATPHAAYAPIRTGFNLFDIMGWDEPSRREAFARSAMKRVTLAMMKRNAMIAAGNLARSGTLSESERTAVWARVRAIAGDAHEDALVRATARAVVMGAALPGSDNAARAGYDGTG